MAEDVTLGEIDRRLRDLTEEIRGLRTELVRRDVYDANRITDGQRLFALEQKVMDAESERRVMRRLVYGGVMTAVAGFATTVGAHFIR